MIQHPTSNIQTPDLVIFDCDGTLVDSESVNGQAVLDVLHEEGITNYDLDHVLNEWVGHTLSASILKVQMETGRMLPADVGKRYTARVAELQKTALRAVRGADDLVAAAARSGKICVASNGERNNVLSALDIAGLMKYFTADTVFTKNQVQNPKPYPDLFLFAASRMGVEPSRVLVIEDSGAGVQAGRAAGMTVWGFTGTHHDPASQEKILLQAGAHDVFKSLIHIRERLEG